MSILLVLVAHDGRTLQLDVQGATRVDAVQQALVSFTGINVCDQIVMCHGARLDPAKPLSAYKLPVANPAAAEDQPVFLYHKAFLRPGAAPPPTEPLPVLEVAVPGLPSVGLRHPLQSAHSPLIRALPDYEAQFMQQLGEARAFWEASQLRLHKCRQLMSEQEVQARAADAARANVESHYNYIASMYSTFVDKYVVQHRYHSKLLSQFASLSAAMATIELPPQLATPSWRVLADLQPNRARLAEWHDSCSRSHEHFAQKVAELENVFQLLRTEVERLFLQAPSVDLDALGSQLNEAESLIDEQGSVVQVLSKDLLTVKQLVEDVVAQLGGSAGGASLSGAAVHDACAAVDTMHDNHLQSLLPRVRAADASATEFLLRCADAKARMTRDVLVQLQGIAAQQSRIRDMKHKLTVFNEVLTRQAAAFNELQTTTRLPAAYRLALAECARRAAWQEMFAGQAGRLAEHCGRITAKEAAKRDSVRKQLEKHLPVELLAKAGLLQEPPHCTVSVPPGDAFLLPVTPADISRLPAIIHQAAEAAASTASGGQQQATKDAASKGLGTHGDGSGSSAAAAVGASSGGQQASTVQAAPGSRRGTARVSVGASIAVTGAAGAASMLAASAWGMAGRTDGAAAGLDMGTPGATGTGSNLALENARLRAELAAVLAQQAARELGEEAAGAAGGSSAASIRTVVGSTSVLGASNAAQQGAGSITLTASSATTAAARTGEAAAEGAEGPAAAAAAASKPYGHGGMPVVPARVAAPLPSVTAVLQQVAQSEEEQAAALAAQQALALAPVQAALAAKDELVACLDARCSALAAEVASFEARIAQLEEQLAGQPVSRSITQQQHAVHAAQQQQQRSGGAQEQRDTALAGRTGAASHAASSMVQSVAPAFVLDATQNASYFGGHHSSLAASSVLPRPSTVPVATTVPGATVTASAEPADAAMQDQAATESAAPVHAAAAVPDTLATTAPMPAAPVLASEAVSETAAVPASAAAAAAAVSETTATLAPAAVVGAVQPAAVPASVAPAPAAVTVPETVAAGPAVVPECAEAVNSTISGQWHRQQPDEQQRQHDDGQQQQSYVMAREEAAGPVQPRSAAQLAGREGLPATTCSAEVDAEQQQRVTKGVVVAQQSDNAASPAGPEEEQTAVQDMPTLPTIGPAADSSSSSSGGSTGKADSSTAGMQPPPSVAQAAAAVSSAATAVMPVAEGVMLAVSINKHSAGADGSTASATSSGTNSGERVSSIAGALSASEPDLRTAIVAKPGQHDQQCEQQQPVRCTSVDSAAAQLAAARQTAGSSRRSVDGALPSGSTAAAGTGLTSLLSSSMHYFFHRGSSKGDSSSSKGGSSNSSTAVSPPMSPPAAAAALSTDQPQSPHGSSVPAQRG